VVFQFDQTVEGNFGAVRVYDSGGNRADQGDAFHPGGTGSLIGVHLKPGLPDGTYTATYRVVSADGHIVSGGFTFSIGKPGAAGQTVARLLGKSATGPVTEVAFGAARALQYGSIALAVGGFGFLLLIWLPALRALAGGSEGWQLASEAFAARLRRLLLLAALVGAISALAGVALEAATAAGISGWAALKPHILSEEIGTRFGKIWTAGAAAWLAVGVVATGLLHPSSRRAPVLRPASLGATGLAVPGVAGRVVTAVMALPLAALLLLPVLSGHGDTQSPVGVMFPANLIHVTALSLWLGGLASLLFVLPAATRRLEGSERTRLLAGVVSRFSPLALGAVIVLLTTGLIQAYIEVRHPSYLLSTGFGRAVLIKFCLLMALIGLGAVNRQRTLPQLRSIARGGGTPGTAGVVLRRTLRAEVALIVVVLGVTGALASYAPSILRYTGPYSATTTIGPAQLQLTLDPARVGANQLHLYFIDARTGAQIDNAQQVTVAASLPSKQIGPLSQDGIKSGPGHYTVTNLLLNVPGTWQLQVTELVSKFDQYNATVSVPVR
jgi:copper transport protein